MAEDLDNLVSSCSTSARRRFKFSTPAAGCSRRRNLPAGHHRAAKIRTLAVSRALQGIRDNEEEIIDADNVRKKVIAMPRLRKRGQSRDRRRLHGRVDGRSVRDHAGASTGFCHRDADRPGPDGVLGVLLAHTITAPIKGHHAPGDGVAEGQFDEQVPVYGDDEIGQLSAGVQLHDRTGCRKRCPLNEEEKEKLASILANMSDGVVATDEHGQVIVTNRRAREMLGVKAWRSASRMSTSCSAFRRNSWTSCMTGDRAFDHVVLDRCRMSGERVADACDAYADLSPGPDISGAIAVLHDVTEQEQLERSRREFVANVSHELRTPLTTIKSYVEALDDGALEDPELARGSSASSAAKRTDDPARDGPAASVPARFEAGAAWPRKDRCAGDAGRGVGPFLFSDAAEVAFGDRCRSRTASRRRGSTADQIDQVLDNLVSNAIKYTQDGGHIEIAARKHDARTVCQFSVKDNGIGIPKKDLRPASLNGSTGSTRRAPAAWAARGWVCPLPGKLSGRTAARSRWNRK